MADKGLEDLPEGMFKSLFLFRRVYFTLLLCGGTEKEAGEKFSRTVYTCDADANESSTVQDRSNLTTMRSPTRSTPWS